IKIDYISPLAKAQRSAEAEGIMAVTEYAMAVARVMPEAADIVDFSEALRTLADIYGLKTKMVRSPEAVAEIREMRQQQEQQAQAAAMATEAAKALPGLGKEIEAGSPLSLVAGGMEA
ncbi:MAG: portal protein, partial [Syntrophus sp. (in: bacteria)]|nr:portal protein [Syntrophus sp. (in: bacteria)]